MCGKHKTYYYLPSRTVTFEDGDDDALHGQVEERVILEVEKEADTGLEEASLAESVIHRWIAHAHDRLHELYELQPSVAQTVPVGLALVEEGLAGIVD